MSLPKMLFNQLGDNDYFGLKVLKNGFKSGTNLDYDRNVSSTRYLQDIIITEAKEMNTSVKVKYLDDYTNDLQNKNKKAGFSSGKDANLCNKEM